MSASWVELRVLVPAPARADADGAWLGPLADACHAVSPGGFVLEDDRLPVGDDAPPPPGHVRLKVYVTEAEVEAASARLSVAAAAFGGATVERRPLDPDWRERWKRWFRGFDISPRLSVRPPWEVPEGVDPRDPSIVVVEPGMAFGTGQHETTRLCLEALDALCEVEAPPSLLDVGCGTGILAIAARKLGVSRVVAVDHDPEAVRCAGDNAARNGVTEGLALSTTPLAHVPGRYPVVVANILAHVLADLADELVAHTEPGGRLILSGVLATQAEELRARFERAGARASARTTRGEWVRLDFERPA